MVVRLFVDASYGVHKDGKSHTGSCVVIGEVEAVSCTSSKQDIVVKSSTEGELVAASNSVNQGYTQGNSSLRKGTIWDR
jgi:hypothetical protein